MDERVAPGRRVTTAKPGTLVLLQWVLVLVCVAVVAFTLAAALERPPAPDPTQSHEWDGFGEGLVGAALLLVWCGTLLPASALLLAIRLRKRAVSWAALILASALLLIETALTVADGLEGWGDGRPWLLAAFAGVILLAAAPGSRAYLGIARSAPR